MLADGLSSAFVVHFEKDVRPTVFEEVERSLSIESEHGEPVTGGHTVSQALHAVAWGSLGILGSGLRELRDSHDHMLAALEGTSVGAIGLGD